jgi:hypothetical protein
MPITVFLAGQAFELEDIQAMSAAFVAACDALHLKISDPAARFVAEKVIALARRGIRDPDVLRTMTLKELGLSDESHSVATSECGQAGRRGKRGVAQRMLSLICHAQISPAPISNRLVAIECPY